MVELFQRLNWVDILALILLIRITYVSSRIGVGKQILPFVLLVFILAISLHNYKAIASFFIERYSFMPSLCKFLSYALIVIIFMMVYHVASRIIGFCLFPSGIDAAGKIEKVGGTIFGLVRSVFIIGMVMIVLVLTPVRFVESSVKKSFVGAFSIGTSLRIYRLVAKLLFRDNSVSHEEELSELFSEKERYLFEGE